jgi:hypothetical protein
MLKEEEEIISVILDGDGALTSIRTCTIRLEVPSPKPLIIGSSAVSSGSSIVILGGGAVCFSFGAFWNSACFTLDFIESIRDGPGCPIWKSQDGTDTWRYFETFEITTRPMLYNRMPNGSTRTLLVSESLTIPRKRITSPADFTIIVYTAQPTILEGLELGSCTEIWTSEYLKEKIGVDRKVRSPPVLAFNDMFKGSTLWFPLIHCSRLLFIKLQWTTWISTRETSPTLLNRSGNLLTQSTLEKSCIYGHFHPRGRLSFQLTSSKTFLRLQQIFNYQWNLVQL